MKVSYRTKKLAPLAAVLLVAVGSLVLLILEEEQQSYYDNGYLRRQLLSTSQAELTYEQIAQLSDHDYGYFRRQLLSTSQAGLTDEQIALQDTLVCSTNGNDKIDEQEQPSDDQSQSSTTSSTATTIYMGTEPSQPYAGCFVSAIFGISSSQSDTPLDATLIQAAYPNYAFLMFTNMVDLDAPGWQTFLHFDSSKKRMITLSRYPKFLAWKEEFVRKNCPVVFYLDGAQKPHAVVDRFNKDRNGILKSDQGFAQKKHQPLLVEMKAIVGGRKDTQEHMDTTLKWMQEQSDFVDWPEPKYVWANCHIAYNPNSPTFQKVSQYFWDIYADEKLSWRDQPLWGYTLHHFNVKPLPYNPKWLFAADLRRFGGRTGGHRYDMGAEREVEMFVDAVCSGTEKEGEDEEQQIIVLEGVEKNITAQD